MLFVQHSFATIENWILFRMPEEAGQGEQQSAGGAGDAGEGHGEGHGWYHGEPHGEGHCEGHLDHGWMMMNKSLSWQC